MVSGDVASHPEFHPAHTVALGLGDRTVGGPAIMRDVVAGDDSSSPVRAMLAVHKNGPVLLRVDDRHYQRDLVICRAAEPWHRNAEIPKAGCLGLRLLFAGQIRLAAKIDDGLYS